MPVMFRTPLDSGSGSRIGQTVFSIVKATETLMDTKGSQSSSLALEQVPMTSLAKSVQ